MSQNNLNQDLQHGNVSYGLYFLVWFALLVLTGLSVTVVGIDFGKFTVAIAMIVSCVKSYLVLTVFMHLKSENPVFRIFVGVALFFLVVSFALLFSDYSFM